MAETAKTLGCCEQTVLNQRKRFLVSRPEGVAALGNLPRTGRSVANGSSERAHVTALMCEMLWKREPLLNRQLAKLTHTTVEHAGQNPAVIAAKLARRHRSARTTITSRFPTETRLTQYAENQTGRIVQPPPLYKNR